MNNLVKLGIAVTATYLLVKANEMRVAKSRHDEYVFRLEKCKLKLNDLIGYFNKTNMQEISRSCTNVLYEVEIALEVSKTKDYLRFQELALDAIYRTENLSIPRIIRFINEL